MFVKKLLLFFQLRALLYMNFSLATRLRSEESDYNRDNLAWGWVNSNTVYTAQGICLQVTVTLSQERNIFAYGVNLGRVDWNKK